MRKKTTARAHLTDDQRDQLIAFLRDWLPEDAKQIYRDMIQCAPDSWWEDPHFQGGIIIDYALRGNGFDEKALGVINLEPLWPSLLARAVDAHRIRRADRGHA